MRLGNVEYLLKKEEAVFVEEVDEQTDYLIYNIKDEKYKKACELNQTGEKIILIPYDAFWILMDGKMVRDEGEEIILLFYAQKGEPWPFFDKRIKNLIRRRKYMQTVADRTLEELMKQDDVYAFGRLFYVRYDFEKKNSVLLELFEQYIEKASGSERVGIAAWLLEEKKKFFTENLIEIIEGEQTDKAFGLMELSLEERFPNCRYDEKKLSKAKNKPYSEWKAGDTVLFGIWMHGQDGALKAISWKVLDVEKNKILLISKEIIHRHVKFGYMWNKKTVNQWLDEFYETAFDMEEKGRILQIKERYVTFLTRKEVEKFMPDDDSRMAKRTAWAFAQNKSPYSDSNKWVLNETKFEAVLEYGGIISGMFADDFGIRPVICISKEN